jgi:hypothetical protein
MAAGGQEFGMADNAINGNDQAANREDGNAPGTWPGSGTTVDGPVETATSGILAGAENDEKGDGTRRASASTSAEVQEPTDRLPDR